MSAPALLELVERLVIRRDADGGVYLVGEFPKVIEISDTLLACADPKWLEASPTRALVRFWLINARADYTLAAETGLGTSIYVRQG